MAQRAPVLVNGRCDVMREHIERSGAGFHYDGIDDMVAKIGRLAALDPAERARIGAAGREYVLANYREEHVRARLVGQVERVIGAAAG